MSDHVDGPRSIGEPAADVTDLFAFTSPANPARTVLAMCVFPSAGEDAIFSNVIDHSIVVRRVTIAGTGNAAKFAPADGEIRFIFRFDTLKRDASGQASQRGVCVLPDGRQLSVAVNDEDGSSTPEGDVRVFAGLRSDPFYLAWFISELKRLPNLLQHDNVLCMVVEIDTNRWLEPGKGSLFGVIAETVPTSRPKGILGPPVRRIDWVGRPEQSNMRLNNPAMMDIDDLRDLWNQQTPFAISRDLQPLFLKRLKDSFATWDMLDGSADWTPERLAANANVFLDDFLLFDVTKPIDDKSHLEIEKSTLDGRPYQTGGGRTIDANSIDILLTWLVNRDREFLQGGATGATKPGMKVFPYLATPNSDLQIIAEHVELAANPDEVWSFIGPFGGAWHPGVATIRLSGSGIGQLRTIEMVDGRRFIDRLEALDDAKRCVRYTNIAGIPVSRHTSTLEVKPKDSGCVVDWQTQFLASNLPDGAVKRTMVPLVKTGLESLKSRFGAAP
ncbi:MAG TPA: DUF4331 family protein [Steroidobacteraceae bacterium]|jgi:hypothetical protein|nr:DUF4331 family protein [Steroidobacteraceae bacterium]